MCAAFNCSAHLGPAACPGVGGSFRFLQPCYVDDQFYA